MKAKVILSMVIVFVTFYLAHLDNSQAEIEQLNNNISINTKEYQQVKQKKIKNNLDNETLLKNKADIQISRTPLPETDEEKIFRQIIQNAAIRDLSSKSMEEIIQVTAETFLSAKYKAGLLDRSNQETLVISFKEFDCLLFVETVLALSRTIALQETSYQAFEQHIIDQRYWNGSLNGYCSRLHYFSEWIYDNQKRKNIEDISIPLHGISQNKKLYFMSKHRNLYPLLINNDDNYKCIVEIESNITNQNIPTNYIAKKEIKNIYRQLRPGDKRRFKSTANFARI